MKPNLYRQYLVDNLKELKRLHGRWKCWDSERWQCGGTDRPEPPRAEVEIDWQHLKLKLVADTYQNDCTGGQAVLLKHQSRFHVVVLTNKDGLWIWDSGGQFRCGRRVQFGDIAAVIAEPDLATIEAKLQELNIPRRIASLKRQISDAGDRRDWDGVNALDEELEKLEEVQRAQSQRADRADRRAGQPAVLRRNSPRTAGRRDRVPASAQRA